MIGEPKIGSTFQRRFVVTCNHLIPFADEQMPPVLATPHLLHEMEKTAREAVAGLLEPHERTVGTHLDIQHLAPSLEGAEVTCTARVLGYEAGQITFQIEASDAVDLLARGLHRRRVVDTARLRRRAARKREQLGL